MRRHVLMLNVLGLLGIGCLLGLASPARASIIVEPVSSIPYTQTDFPTGADQLSLSFPEFNPSLGVLNSVELDVSSEMQTQLTVQNQGTAPSSGTAYTELQISVTDPADAAEFASDVPELDFNSPHYNYTNLGAGDQVTSGVLTKTSSDDNTYVTSPVLAEFTGAGTIMLPVSTVTQTWTTYTGGNSDSTQSTQANLSGTVTYSYTAYTPEPASIGLLLVGSLGLLARRRHRA